MRTRFDQRTAERASDSSIQHGRYCRRPSPPAQAPLDRWYLKRQCMIVGIQAYGVVLSSLRIERTGVPIYVQIREQMLRAIGAGVVRPGEKMPTMRQVAVALRVDLNTVRHAYDALARIGAITVQPARGTFVSERPPPTDATVDAKRIDDVALRTIAAAHASGLEPRDIAYRILAIAKQQDDRT